MTAFISAGHNPFGIKPDPGAVANDLHEADLTVEFRDLVVEELVKLKVKTIIDKDDERLAQYLERIKTGSGSVVLEFHFDSTDSKVATGTTAIYGRDATQLDKDFAKELVDTTAIVLNIRNRGVVSEASSHRGSLGLMREQGIVALLELGFISNKDDIKAYNDKKFELAKFIAAIVKKYEDKIV